MAWLRMVVYRCSFNCCYEGTEQLAVDAVGERMVIIQRFLRRPMDDISSWANRVAYDDIQEKGDLACRELSNSFSVCSINIGITYTSEVGGVI